MGAVWRWHRDGRKLIDGRQFGFSVHMCGDPEG